MDTLISESQPSAPTSSLGRLLAVTGSFCLFAPLVGLSITVVSMVRSFAAMSQSAPATDPSIVSRSVGEALIATAIGLGFSMLGICLVCIAIFAFRYRPPWLRSMLIAAALFLFIAFPIGTAISVIAIVILVRKPNVFASPRNA